MSVKILNFIAGQTVEPASQSYVDNVDPATGSIYSQVPDSDQEDLDRAVSAALAASPHWEKASAATRGRALSRLADLVEARFEDFARAECIDTGKPLGLCRTVDIPRAIANLRMFAGAAESFGGQTFANPSSKSYTLRQPLGVVATISPWNLPLLLLTWKMAPALAAGNCVVVKPSEVTPMTAFMLSQLFNEAGFPPGVVAIVHGRGPKIGAAITKHPHIAAVSFTGGTSTGSEIYATASQHLKKVSLELGGKNPVIVFSDCDLAKAIDGAMAAAFTNQGQVCLCGSRFLVQKNIYQSFKDAFVKRTKALHAGDPLLEHTKFGAVISKQHMEKVLSYIELAKSEGGHVLTGGRRLQVEGRCAQGYFIEPTVIEGLPNRCRTNQEEIFGPVVTLIPFETEEEAIALPNDSKYGLASSVWSEDKDKTARVAASIETGIVWINCWNLRDLETPFGGMKKSGIGREGKQRAMEFFTEEKTVTMLMNSDDSTKLQAGAPSQSFVSVKAPDPVGLYPHARRAGSLLFLSGIGPRKKGSKEIPGVTLDASGQVIRHNIEEQCHSVFANVRAVLESCGAKWEDLVDVTVYLTNMKKDFPIYNRLWAEYFKNNPPCRTTVEVTSLPTPIAIELKCVAALTEGNA